MDDWAAALELFYALALSYIARPNDTLGSGHAASDQATPGERRRLPRSISTCRMHDRPFLEALNNAIGSFGSYRISTVTGAARLASARGSVGFDSAPCRRGDSAVLHRELITIDAFIRASPRLVHRTCDIVSRSPDGLGLHSRSWIGHGSFWQTAGRPRPRLRPLAGLQVSIFLYDGVSYIEYA